MLNQHMLSYMINQGLLASGGSSPAALEDITSYTDTSNSQTYSTTASLSYAAGDQLVIMAAGRAANNAWPADQVELSIDSTECTILSSSTESNAYGCWTAIGVLEATSSGSSFACAVDVSPTDTDDAANCTIIAAVVSSGGIVDSALCDTSVGSVTLNQETDGYVLAIATSFDVGTDSITWTNITKLGQSNLENNSPSWAGNTTSSTGSLTIDADDSDTTAAISAVSFASSAGASIQSLGFIAPVTVGIPSYIGSSSTNGSSSLSLTGITGLAEGDIVVACLSDDDRTVSITSSGWTTIASGSTNNIAYAFAYKVMGATPDTSITVSTTIDALTATAFRDVEYESISSVGTDSGTTFGSPPSATVTLDDSIVLMLACIDDDISTISTPSTGYTVAAENGRSTGRGAGGSNAQMYKTGVSAGTESPSSYSWSISETQICATVVLKPLGAAARQAAGFSLGALDYEADYGSPDYTITSFPSTGAGVGSGDTDVLIAIDANISATDDGVLIDLGGGGGNGMAVGVNNGTLRARAFDTAPLDTAWGTDVDAAEVEVDISSYTGADATYYIVVDASTFTLTVYVQEGGKGSFSSIVQLGTDTAGGGRTSPYGSDAKGYGQRSNTTYDLADLGADYEVNFTGTIAEIRYWAEDAALDVSDF